MLDALLLNFVDSFEWSIVWWLLLLNIFYCCLLASRCKWFVDLVNYALFNFQLSLGVKYCWDLIQFAQVGICQCPIYQLFLFHFRSWCSFECLDATFDCYATVFSVLATDDARVFAWRSLVLLALRGALVFHFLRYLVVCLLCLIVMLRHSWRLLIWPWLVRDLFLHWLRMTGLLILFGVARWLLWLMLRYSLFAHQWRVVHKLLPLFIQLGLLL